MDLEVTIKKEEENFEIQRKKINTSQLWLKHMLIGGKDRNEIVERIYQDVLEQNAEQNNRGHSITKDKIKLQTDILIKEMNRKINREWHKNYKIVETDNELRCVALSEHEKMIGRNFIKIKR